MKNKARRPRPPVPGPPSGPTKLIKGSDLLALLRSLPSVDDEYLNAVEEVARRQPLLPAPTRD